MLSAASETAGKCATEVGGVDRFMKARGNIIYLGQVLIRTDTGAITGNSSAPLPQINSLNTITTWAKASVLSSLQCVRSTIANSHILRS